mgnify:CR=1 FL=1
MERAGEPLTRALRSSKKPLPGWFILLFTQLTTMVLIGMWHGITWSFIIWGLWQGVGLFVGLTNSDQGLITNAH